MGIEVVTILKKAIEDAPWPTNDDLSLAAFNAYEKALDLPLTYRGDFHVYVDALRILNGSGSRPYAMAGIAAILLEANYAYDGPGATIGNSIEAVDEAARWLAIAQQYAPDQREINFIEAWMYVDYGRLDDARLVLDHLQKSDNEEFFRLSLTEYRYWSKVEHEKRADWWFEKAKKQANTKIKKLYMLNRIASKHMDKENFEKAIGAYKKVMKLDNGDAWAPHNIAWMYNKMGNYQAALPYSNRALEIMNFETGHQLNKGIRQSLAKQKATQQKTKATSPKQSLFKRLFAK